MAVLRFNQMANSLIKGFISLALLLGILLAYFFFWPVPVEPQAWDAPAAREYTGDFAVNTELDDFTALALDGLTGPEAVVQGPHGYLYATSHEGWILRWLENQEPQKWVKLPARPLGIALDKEANVWAACVDTGLLKITPQGEISTELTQVDGQDIRYADDLDIANNGKIYLSDASTKFFPSDWGGTLAASLLDILEHAGNGRVIEYDSNSGSARVVKKGLNFANGIAIDPAQQFVLVVETGSYRVWKLWIAGQRVGQEEIIIDNLPGFPDNIHVGKQGRFWVGLTAPRAQILDNLSRRPAMRKVVQRLPAFMRPKVVHYGAVFAINESGQVISNKQSPTGKVYATTGVAETDDYLYITSLTAPFLARITK